MRRQPMRRSSAKLRKVLLVQEGEGLRHLVDEFSRYARMPAPRPRPTDLHEVANQVMQLYAGIHPRIAMRTELDPAVPQLNLDSDQMKRALINLVDNAVAAVEGKGAIQLSLSVEGEALRYDVADDGVGVPAGVKEQIFRREYFKNTGFGLYLSREILSMTGISICETGTPGRGARFEITIPPSAYRYLS